MKRGTISINESVMYINQLNGNVLMTRHEIADLFGVYISTVDINLRAIFKSEVLREADVCHTHQYIDKNSMECQILVYNLEIITALSYRLKSKNAKIFREWINKKIVETTTKMRTSIIVHCQDKLYFC
jgi:hypothetical protein